MSIANRVIEGSPFKVLSPIDNCSDLFYLLIGTLNKFSRVSYKMILVKLFKKNCGLLYLVVLEQKILAAFENNKSTLTCVQC